MNLQKLICSILFLILLILHQDFWQWDRNEILFGFMPYTMAYNIGISLLTGLTWVLVCVFLWPVDLEHVESELVDSAAQKPVKDQ